MFTVVSVFLGMHRYFTLVREFLDHQTRDRGMPRKTEIAAHYGRGLEASVPCDPAHSTVHWHDRAGREVIAWAPCGNEAEIVP